MKDKLFIFDLDGTILKLNISAEQLFNTKTKINAYFKKYGIQDNLRPLIPKIIFLPKIATKDRKLQEELIRDSFSIIDEMETNPDGGIEIKQENVDLLNDLKERGIKIGLISNNGRKGVLNALDKIGFDEDFLTFIITRDDVSLPKPFVDPYLKISNYLSKYNCSLFTDDIFDFLPLINSEEAHNWNIKKYIVLQMDIINQSYDWVTLNKMDFGMLKEEEYNQKCNDIGNPAEILRKK